ncbi:XdhC family protein [bacterium]|nr:XdhC family protein [bacterium]
MKNKFWQKAHDFLEKNELVYVVAVVSGEGSAPNRVGAKILVSHDEIFGTIGGGRSEHLIVEKVKEYIAENEQCTQIAVLEHRKDADENASGMICNGSQTYAIVALTKEHLPHIKNIINAYTEKGVGKLSLSPHGLIFKDNDCSQERFSFINQEDHWEYHEILGVLDKLYIVGGGHCSISLSQLMINLGFHVTVYENSENIQTYNENIYANEKFIVDYDNLPDIIPNSPHTYIAIMTFGHAYDQYVLEKLIGKDVKYLGMMGSQSKVKAVFANLKEKGVKQELFDSVHAPIGLNIKSNTPEEIAVSIAGEIIKIRNSG